MNNWTSLPLLLLLVLSRSALGQPNPVERPPETAVAEAAAAQRLLDEYVTMATAKSPTLSAQRARHSSARELVTSSDALPDPMVGIMYQSMGPPWDPMPPMSMVQGELVQTIPGVGKRQSRRNVAEADAKMRYADIGATKARVTAEVRSLFAQIYAIDREKQAIESAGELVTVMAGAIAGQFASGQVDQEALARVELERSRLREQLLDVKTNRVVLVARLNRLMARTEDAPVPRLDALPEVALDVKSVDDALAKAPELRVQRAAIAAAERRRESAEAEGHPDFTVGLAGGATTSGEPVFTVRLGMALPVWQSNKQAPMIRAARRESDAAESEYREAMLKVRGELAELQARFRRDTDQIQLYRQSIVPTAALAFQAARNAYSTGRADFGNIIEDFRLWLDAQVGLSRREAERLMTWAELQALVDHAH